MIPLEPARADTPAPVNFAAERRAARKLRPRDRQRRLAELDRLERRQYATTVAARTNPPPAPGAPARHVKRAPPRADTTRPLGPGTQLLAKLAAMSRDRGR